MAQSAHKLAVSEGSKFPSQVEPIKLAQGPYVRQGLAVVELGVPVQPRIPERLNPARRRTSEFLISTNQIVGELYRSFTNLASASKDVAKSSRTRVERLKKERPLQLLAVIGGTALVLGVVARVWRSRRHA